MLDSLLFSLRSLRYYSPSLPPCLLLSFFLSFSFFSLFRLHYCKNLFSAYWNFLLLFNPILPTFISVNIVFIFAVSIWLFNSSPFSAVSPFFLQSLWLYFPSRFCCNTWFKIILWKFQHLCHLGVVFYWLLFLLTKVFFFPFLLHLFFFSTNFCVLESVDITLQRLWILLYSFEEYSSSQLSWLNSNSKCCFICDEDQWKYPLWTLVFYWFSWSSPCICKSGLSWESRQVWYLDSELSICTSSFLWFLPSFPSTLVTPHFVLWLLRPVLDFLLEAQSRHSTQLGMCPQ